MKYRFLNQDEKEKLSRYLINVLKWSELKFCICDIRYFYGLKTTLKIIEFDVDGDDLMAIQRNLGAEKSFIEAKENNVVICWK